MTVHAAKGPEFPVVIVPEVRADLVWEGRLPNLAVQAVPQSRPGPAAGVIASQLGDDFGVDINPAVMYEKNARKNVGSPKMQAFSRRAGRNNKAPLARRCGCFMWRLPEPKRPWSWSAPVANKETNGGDGIILGKMKC